MNYPPLKINLEQLVEIMTYHQVLHLTMEQTLHSVFALKSSNMKRLNLMIKIVALIKVKLTLKMKMAANTHSKSQQFHRW